MENAVAIIHAGPALGARFVEYTAELQAGGKLGPTAAQRFFYVVTGEIRFDETTVTAGGYAFIPEGERHLITAVSESRLIVIEKPYQRVEDRTPRRFLSNVEILPKQPLMGDEGVQVQALIPDSPEFDFAVNLMTFAPGAALSLVEAHIMEHGLMLMEGGGIYKLGDHWYPVMAGDFIWMAPYCPQWFGAIGKTPAKYLIYKDWNRHPL